MSEFSESYHLRNATQDDAVQLLKRAGLKGIVFPTMMNWTSFVPSGRDWEGLTAIVQANQGFLLHYSYGEDHGWVIDVYQGSEKRSHFEHWWDTSEDIEDLDTLRANRPSNQLDLVPFTEWLQNSNESMDVLQECFEVDGQDRAYRFAELIGLQHFRWISPSYLSYDPAGFRGEGTVLINGELHNESG